jgi:ubiquinone/menaquinone biosynthesis C-methylase UbiE
MTSTPAEGPPTELAVQRLLACPACRGPLRASDGALACARCAFDGLIVEGVVVVGDRSRASFFDARHGVMEAGKACDGAWCLCYEQQAKVVEPLLRPGSLVLDVGCGPSLPYAKPADCFVIGLDASYDSIRANRSVDLRVYGTAAALPLPDASIDTIVCFYSIHHMTGRNVRENRAIVARVFRELARVLKPGGELLVFEVSPWRPVWHAERRLWDVARRLLGSWLDMFFYPAEAYRALGAAALPGAEHEARTFGASMLDTFPPAFSLPWLRVPRFLYPFHVALYRWRR